MFYDFELYRDDVQEYVVEWLRGYWRDLESLAVRLGSSSDIASLREQQQVTVDTFYEYLVDGTTSLQSGEGLPYVISVQCRVNVNARSLQDGYSKLSVDMQVRTGDMVPGDIGALVSALESIAPQLSGIEMRLADLERTLTDRFDLDLLDAARVEADRRHRKDRDLYITEIDHHSARALADKILQLYVVAGRDPHETIEYQLEKKERRLVQHIAPILKHEHRRGLPTRFTPTALGARCLRARKQDADLHERRRAVQAAS